MIVYTIGFTKKKAEYFFSALQKSGVKRVVDVRLNNVSQLAGFAKRDDLKYFLNEISKIDYIHIPELAPDKEILDSFKKKKGDWDAYQDSFIKLITKRQIDKKYAGKILVGDCLMCSEDKPDNCHRRLVLEYFQKCWGNITIKHIL
ncbi:DUF488 domain-containing protein [Desulfobacterales bacterium HSG17]|nr:DUF488 domain-containing protein [Desulfobacterales bacterium HSG17]